MFEQEAVACQLETPAQVDNLRATASANTSAGTASWDAVAASLASAQNQHTGTATLLSRRPRRRHHRLGPPDGEDAHEADGTDSESGWR